MLRFIVYSNHTANDLPDVLTGLRRCFDCPCSVFIVVGKKHSTATECILNEEDGDAQFGRVVVDCNFLCNDADRFITSRRLRYALCFLVTILYGAAEFTETLCFWIILVFFVLLPADRVLSAGSELAALIVLWVYAVCGGASYILILIRTFSSSISHNNHSITSRLPATIFSSRKATKVSDEVVTVNITQIVHRDVQIAVQGDEFYSVELQAMKGSQAVYKADYNNWN